MAFYFDEPSRTFSEYLLLPNLTTKGCTPENIDLRTPLVKFKKGEKASIHINIPLVSSIMQSVSDSRMAIELARCGGLSFIYCSQPIDQQVEMVRKVKKYKAGFVVSDSNLKPDDTLADVLALKEKTGHSTIAVTEDGSPTGKLLGLVTSRDYRISRTPLETRVGEFMTPFESLIYAEEGVTLKEANDMIWDHKLNCLPIIDKNQNLLYLVFRKDYDSHKENPYELLDAHKRYMTGAGINTRDYAERVPALVDTGIDVLCVDSSDGYTEYQRDTIRWVKEKYKGEVMVGGGNVVDKDAFMYLVESGADFVKVGIGGGSICITRETKGIGRGQATAVIEVAKARAEYYEKQASMCLSALTGIVYHMALALRHGADFRCWEDTSPGLMKAPQENSGSATTMSKVLGRGFQQGPQLAEI